jgi:hypothetical protein
MVNGQTGFDRLESEVGFPKRIFICVSGLFGFALEILFRKARFVPALPRDFGMVWGSQGFFRTNTRYPLVDRLFVSQTQLIEIRVVHTCGC